MTWISTIFYTYKDLRKDETILDILNYLIDLGEPFIPEKHYLGKSTRNRCIKFKIKEKEKIYKKIRELISSYDIDDCKFSFVNEKKHVLKIDFLRRPYEGEPHYISIDLEDHFFKDIEFCSKFLDIAKYIYYKVSPIRGHIHESTDSHRFSDDERRSPYFRTPKFYMFWWASFLSPNGVGIYGGTEKIKNAPCYKVETLDDGGALLVLAPTPLNPNSKEFREKQNKLLSYFNMPVINDLYFENMGNIMSLTESEEKEKKQEGYKPKKQPSQEFLERIKTEADLFENSMKDIYGITLEYNYKDLEKIEEVIKSDIEIGKPQEYVGWTQTLGSYFGELLIKNFGGEWIERDPEFNIPAVKIKSAFLFPHTKVYKRFENGISDSLTSYYTAIQNKVSESK